MRNTSEWPTDDIEIIIRKYGDMLYRLSLIMLKNESDAEDVVQETIIKYYQKAPTFVDSEHEKAWLIKVATNKCRDLLRIRGRYIQIEENFLEQIADELEETAEVIGKLIEQLR